MKKLFFISLTLIFLSTQAQENFPLPTNAQKQWQDMEFYLFVHFGPNTFTGEEWGSGKEKAELFNPTQLDCNQWCKIAKAAGAKGIILTAKHHDGFCLWPSKFSNHTVKQSIWENGNGDVLKKLSIACKTYGLKMGVYLSPWDRNHPDYGTDKYNDVFINMMKEVVANYGPFFEFWWDGANGEGPNGKKQIYDWKRFEQTMRNIAPNTILFSDIGPDARWVGNENGIAGTTNWNNLDTATFTRGLGAPSTKSLNEGNENGKAWIPAECDVSIRPGWFYHSTENNKVKTPQQLFNLYLKTVGRGANFLLNVPPNTKGLFNAEDSASLIGFKKLLDDNFKNNLLKNAMLQTVVQKNKRLEIERREISYQLLLKNTEKINCIVLKENMKNGQLIKQATVSISNNGEIVKQIFITTVGRKRILTFPAVNANEVVIVITHAKAKPALQNIEGYLIDESLIEKQ
ncbi:MAG: alpha-L-fucosidase [Bacteroidetes bacterium]|nr:alpha-L-fucosidase [Bacteroidota bacterium]MBS1671924.1 alpha-L-fucosidase [Bacteroidota bacterium]